MKVFSGGIFLLVASALASCGGLTAAQQQPLQQPPPQEQQQPTAAAAAVAPSPAAGPEQQQFDANGCGPRLRKAWEMLTPTEKDVYIRAVARTMDDGLYVKFVEIHTEQMTTAEAHRTCMFVYWHRLLLLGFENLLRSYGGEFACITIPYWNYVDQNARFMAGDCASMEACSPILQELGGSSAGRMRSVTVNGTPVTGRCVSRPPLDHFCEASSLDGPACAHCVPRGTWSRAAFPPTTTVSSLMRQLFSTQTIEDVSNNLEQGVHNTVHNSLGGVMGVLEAPADPLFFSHHATIDLLHSIFHHCAIGNDTPLPVESQLTDPRQFVSCPRQVQLNARRAPDRNVLLPQSEVMLRTGEQGTRAQTVRDPANPLERIFAALPSEYLRLADVRDLGEFSYNYAMTGLLADMYTTCGDLSALLRQPLVGGGGGGPVGRRLANDSGNANETLTTTTPTPVLLEAVIVPRETKLDWYEQAVHAVAAKLSSTGQDAGADVVLREVEKMTCLFYNECRGPVIDYSAAFKASFRTTTSTPCHQVVSDIQSGKDHVLVAEWKDVMTQFLSC